MIEKIKETAYDFYVLNVREFYRRYVKEFRARIKQATNMPLWVYREQGFKDTFLDLWQLPELEADEKYMNSLRRCCDKGVEKLRLESRLSSC